MILTGRSLCLPSPATVQELFFVARDASVIPDVSLDPVLTTFLSLDSSAALQHQYVFLQRGMSPEQQTAFGLGLTGELGGSGRVAYGGVGIVALALSMLFDQVAQQVRGQGSAEPTQTPQARNIFGISSSSRIGWIVHSYLRLIPGIASNKEKMGETTELYDSLLKLELLDHYERMTTKKRMSTVAMQQWLTGAAVHLHMRIHQVRLNSVPTGSAQALRLAYKSGFGRLVQDYTVYLYRNIKETPAPRRRRPRTRSASGARQTSTLSTNNITCSENGLFNISLVISSDQFNETATPSSTVYMSRVCKTNGSREDFGLNVSETTADVGNSSAGYIREQDVGTPGLLVIEPGRNVSHGVRHHPCQSPAIQQALVPRIIDAQDHERNRNFFRYPEKVFSGLLRQKNDFELKTNQT